MAGSAFTFRIHSHFCINPLRTGNRFHLTSTLPTQSLFPLFVSQTGRFATQRPKSISSLSNPRTKKTDATSPSGSADSSPSTLTDWSSYDIQLFQYYYDPRSSQIRVLLDYFNLPYDCIEVTPFKKHELSHFQIPEQYHGNHAPLLKMVHRHKLKETVDLFKQQAVQHIPNGLRHESLQIANVVTFRDRIKEHINKHEHKSPGIFYDDSTS